MKLEIKAQTILHDKMGRLRAGKIIEVPDDGPLANQAREWLRRGWAVRYETQAMPYVPLMAVCEPLSASQAAQVSPPQTLSKSESGAKKRGRPKKDKSS